jgi:hypothetical protein
MLVSQVELNVLLRGKVKSEGMKVPLSALTMTVSVSITNVVISKFQLLISTLGIILL